MTRARYAADESLRNLLGTEESETLEFKREVWSDGKEAAKDVAAMANAWGGEILIGVGEERGESRASTFAMTLAADGREREGQRVHQLLEHYLRPRDFVDRLRFSWLTAPSGETVLAIWVPAAARACMAVAHEEGRKGVRFQFPVRTGRETRFMEYDEVLTRMTDHGRAIRIELEGLAPPPPMKARVRIASPIRHLLRGGPYLLRRTEEHGADGEITELRPTSLVGPFARATIRPPRTASWTIFKVERWTSRIPWYRLSGSIPRGLSRSHWTASLTYGMGAQRSIPANGHGILGAPSPPVHLAAGARRSAEEALPA